MTDPSGPHAMTSLQDGLTVLHLAAQARDCRVLELLSGFPCQHRPRDHWKILRMAFVLWRIILPFVKPTAIQWLYSVEARNAVDARRRAGVRRLLSLRSAKGEPTPLHLAAERKQFADYFRRLLTWDQERPDRRALAYLPTRHGATPFSIAAARCPECYNAMKEVLCFGGRYWLEDGPPSHQSATCVVFFAKDLGAEGAAEDGDGIDAETGQTMLVALKIMKDKKQLNKELDLRAELRARKSKNAWAQDKCVVKCLADSRKTGCPLPPEVRSILPTPALPLALRAAQLHPPRMY